jgi:Arc/MetJ-type ribon-helix-helix transcriptional regulator
MKRLQITLDDELYRWLTEEIKKMRFGSYSHAINYALKQLREQAERKKAEEELEEAAEAVTRIAARAEKQSQDKA